MPGSSASRAGTLAGVLVLEVSGDQITAVRLMANAYREQAHRG